MQEVSLDSYRDKQRQTERFYRNEKEQEEMPFLLKAGMGVAAAAGLLAVGHRTGAFRKIAQFLDTEGQAVYQAAKETIHNQGKMFVGQDKLTMDRMKVLKDGFLQRRREILEKQKRLQADPINAREMDMERYLRQRKRLIGGRDDKQKHVGEVPFHVQEGFRFAAVMDEVNNMLPADKLLADRIEHAMQKGRLGILNFGSDEQLQLLLKKHSPNADFDKAWQVLKDARDTYKDTDFLATNQDALRLVEGMQQKLREFTSQQMNTLTKKNNALTNMVIGHKQATVGDVLDMHNAGRFKLAEDLRVQVEEVLSHNKDFRDAVWDENLYLVTKNGSPSSLMDYKSFGNIGRSSMEWWANTLPGGLLHLRDILNIKMAREQASFRILQRGTVQSSLNGHMGYETTSALNEEVIFVNGKLVKLHDYNAVNNDAALEILNPNRDMYFTSSQFGTIGKMQRHIGALMTDNEATRNPVAKFFDVGNQDKDSTFNQGISVFTKFFKDDWERNKMKDYMKNGLGDAEDFFSLNTYFKLNTRGFTPRLLNQMRGHLTPSMENFITKEGISFSNEDDMIKLFKEIGSKEVENPNTPHTELVSLYKQFQRNSDEVLARKTPIGESNPILGHHSNVQTGYDLIHQQTSMYLMHSMLSGRLRPMDTRVMLDEFDSFRGEVRALYENGKILKEDMVEAESLINYGMFRSQGYDIFKNTHSTLIRVNKLFQENKAFQEGMREMTRKTNPLWERYSDIRPVNQVGDDYMLVNKSGFGNHLKTIFGLNAGIKERAAAVGDIGKQLSPFTGRKNMEDVTTLGLFGTYYPMYRLQDTLGNAGIGFSDQSMGNAFSIFTNLATKRILPIYAAVQTSSYVDWKTDQATGEGLDERWENYKANSRLRDAAGRTPDDIYQMKRERALHPGIEHWESMPEIHIPLLGPVSAGDFLNNIFAPFMGKATLREEDMMTYDETLDDLYYGTEEIRKSRYWFAGSKSAFRGDRVAEFAPNSFRKAHSDYEWTNTGATGEEYWGNSMFPTLENPLGGLSFALGLKDPYWYEKKHYYDRPYMLTGELFNPNTVVLGDIGNATIGRLVKPVQEMHPEYWADPILVYDNETSQLGNRPEAPIRTKISPGGRMEHDVLASPKQYGADSVQQVSITEGDGTSIRVMSPQLLTNPNPPSGARYVMTNELDAEGKTTGGYVATDLEANKSIYVPANVAGELSFQEAFQYAEADSPAGSEVKAVTVSTTNPSYQAQVSTQPRAMMDEEYAYKQDIMYRKMMEIQDPRSASWQTQEAYENWTEPLGIYKWLVNDEILGRNPYVGQTVIQRADAAYNTSNRFWESELGGLGGNLSEIGRRFIRRDDGQLDTYNPIRNTMPDWMPGEDYFINFQTGDPYQKIPRGEYRLPGEAYESLNELHPDETGRYGAFDKFKILGDVAPWSDEYKFWSQYLLDTLPEGDLRKEATAIRRQVSQRKEKYDFQPYRFKGNDIVTQEVTVTKFLDDYTFLTKELGDQPIRIAGMEYRKKAEGVLQQYFNVGSKVTIGVAEDPTQQISKDTYGTMRAVIFNEIGNINMDIIRRGAMVENMNDYSAAGIHSRYTQQEINRGARWETVAHASSPLNTKFLQVRTAVEEYERDQVYGKDWATWGGFLMDDYVKPTLEGIGRFDNPLWSMTAGATTGLVLGRLFLRGGKTTKIATVAGALYGLASNMVFKAHEKNTGDALIPERRRIENDINEYFDILKYLKYEGLYQNAREQIVHATGYDIEDIANLVNEQKEMTRQRRNELEDEKKKLFVEQPEGWEDRRKAINAELDTISQDNQSLYLPDAFLQALQYKEERDTTLYGIDPHDDRMKVMRAFPYKDKWFFDSFSNANSEEREKILKLIPDNQRRIYKAIWGYGDEGQKPLEYFMEKYNIPDWTWEGWRPEYNLEDIKVKAVQEAGLDMSDFNFWDDDVLASQYTPDLHEDGNYIAGQPTSSFQGFQALRQNLISILQGQGLYDVQVSVTPSNGSESDVNISYEEDRSREIEEHLRRNGTRYV